MAAEFIDGVGVKSKAKRNERRGGQTHPRDQNQNIPPELTMAGAWLRRVTSCARALGRWFHVLGDRLRLGLRGLRDRR